MIFESHFWQLILDLEKKYCSICFIAIHNAFFDRRFKEDKNEG